MNSNGESSVEPHSSNRLEPHKVPVELREFLPMAEKWGIDDDGDLANALRQASDDELKELSVTVDKMFSEALTQWLLSPGPMAENPDLITKEYVAFTCLITAGELADLILERRAAKE
jgi:hypothetical protein